MGRNVKTFRMDPDVEALIDTKLEHGEFGPWVNDTIRSELSDKMKKEQPAKDKEEDSFPLDASRDETALRPSGVAGIVEEEGDTGVAGVDGTGEEKSRTERLAEYLAHGKRVYSGERDGAGFEAEELRELGGGGYRDIVKVVRRAGEAGGGY